MLEIILLKKLAVKRTPDRLFTGSSAASLSRVLLSLGARRVEAGPPIGVCEPEPGAIG
jgi:hypothetical protein